MHPNCKDCKNYYNHSATKEKKYQLVIMAEDGHTTFGYRFYSWEDIQSAVTEMRDLYEKHGVTHHVGYREA